MSTNTVQKYIFELTDKGFIEIDPTSVITKSGQKRNGNHHYTIRPTQEVVKSYHQRQLQRMEQNLARPQIPKQCAAFHDG